MSAFLVSMATMHKVVQGWLGENASQGPFTNPDGDSTLSQGTILGRKLYAMNHRALRQRYGESGSTRHEKRDTAGYVYSDPRVAPVVCLKAMHCLSYQCSEGNVPDSKLYKDLERQKGRLADSIVSATPAYANAEAWD